jgi:hypothetical protein
MELRPASTGITQSRAEGLNYGVEFLVAAIGILAAPPYSGRPSLWIR